MREYKVVILGPRGAGKTVYLGSLFHRLSTPSEAGYYLKAPFDQQKKLNKVFSKMAYQWPDPTDVGQTDHWNFDVMVRAQDDKSYKALSIHYYDYGGGRMTDIHNVELEKEMETILAGADVFLALLDGQKLKASLSGDETEDVQKFWAEEVQQLCEHMNNHSGKSAHFLISKWDLFQDSDSSLKKVRDALLSWKAFRNLVGNRSGPTRLIPVSSVGYGFAELTPDGKMSIKRNGVGKMPRPLNVEWPFACILPDLIKAELTIAVEEANKREAQLNREVKPSLSLLESLKASLGRFMKSTLKHLNIDEPILDWLADRVTYAADTKEEKAAEIRAQNLKEAEKLRTKINNDRDATQFVLASMLNTVEEMQVAYRSSKIEPADVKKEA